jgi:hypothetical protein
MPLRGRWRSGTLPIARACIDMTTCSSNSDSGCRNFSKVEFRQSRLDDWQIHFLKADNVQFQWHKSRERHLRRIEEDSYAIWWQICMYQNIRFTRIKLSLSSGAGSVYFAVSVEFINLPRAPKSRRSAQLLEALCWRSRCLHFYLVCFCRCRCVKLHSMLCIEGCECWWRLP